MKQSSEKQEMMPKALLKAQKEIGKAIKKSYNPFAKSKYADIESVIDAIKEPLNDNDIIVIQSVIDKTFGEGSEIIIQRYLRTTLLHTSGEWMSSDTPLLIGGKNDSQALGSAITYARRYSLQSMLMLAAADDDGESEQERPKTGKNAVRDSLSKADRKNAEAKDFETYKVQLRQAKSLDALKKVGDSIAQASLPQDLVIQLRDFYEIRKENLE